MNIRDAKEGDSAAIAAIYNHYVLNAATTFEETPVAAEEMAARILHKQADGYDWLVAEVDNQVSGYAYSGRWMTRSAYRFTVEVSVYVMRDVQGRGIGRALYEVLFERLRTGGFHSVIGIISLPNPASIALHESFGMEQVAHYREVGRKFDTWVDVGQWQARL